MKAMEWLKEIFEANGTELTQELGEQINCAVEQRYVTRQAALARLHDIAVEMEIDAQLRGAVHDSDMVKAMLDKSCITVDGTKVCGVTEQIAKLRRDKPFLFCEDSRLTGTAPMSSRQTQPQMTKESFGENKNDPTWINSNWEAVSKALSNKELY